ncbi:conserved hypothetical protein [Neospora caninum Liverpool]|uniref:Uncharacterized protein n=1 Tax=Neospora caninum (strain Liverpool) TaxID=572307 RepID=F0V8Z5_NEOCL|nr:conserved hypothetical protein [Neospora caninum Liverpool]CBZ50186.1 conserved hypothetical protein [Neospora caninum Liverpool]CEL64787.1 TPA: hypothetical protein BN1204_006610 [Neospora caninum Liverpool]|eukprot:XP_003880221.1 conserved hypothetical protein [Neospora caninum Liverpool]
MYPKLGRARGAAAFCARRRRLGLLLGLAVAALSFLFSEKDAVFAVNAKMTLVPAFDLSTIRVSKEDGLHHVLSNPFGKTYIYRAERREDRSASRTKRNRERENGRCAILFFIPGKRLATPSAVVGQGDEPIVWDWAWQWKYHKMGFELEDQVDKVVVAAPQLTVSNESLREDAVDVGEQMMSVLEQAAMDYSCNFYRVYIHAVSHGGLIVRTLMTMDDRIWTPTHRAGGVSQLLVDFHRTLNDSKLFALKSVVFMGVPHAGPRRNLGLRSRVVSALSTWLTKVASYVMEGLSDGLVEFLHEDPDRLLCNVAAAEAQRDYAFDPKRGSTSGSLLFKFGAVASYGLLAGDPVVSTRSSLGVYDGLADSKAAQLVRTTEALQNRPLHVPLSNAPLNRVLRERPWDPLIRPLLTTEDICRTTSTPSETYELTLKILQFSNRRLLGSSKTGTESSPSARRQRSQAPTRNGDAVSEELQGIQETRRKGIKRFIVLLSNDGATASQASDSKRKRFLKELWIMRTSEDQRWLLEKQHALLSHVVHTALLLPMNDSSSVDDLWWDASL